MTNGRNIFLGWGLVLSVTGAALFGLPKLADATSVAKDQVQWQNRAEAFQTSETIIESKSNLAQTHAALHLDKTITNPWMRDYRVTSSEYGTGADIVANAKAAKREQQCLAEAVYYEARSERLPGQKAVAEVVLNRIKSKHFPNSICGVVYEGAERITGCQFSFTCDGSTAKLPKGKAWTRAQAVADHMIVGASAPVTWRSTHYHTTNVNPRWSSTLRQTRQFDTHVFYRFMPRGSQIRPVSVAP
jgi:spore germination cell wall hydrolase CwlJ-like protein